MYNKAEALRVMLRIYDKLYHKILDKFGTGSRDDDFLYREIIRLIDGIKDELYDQYLMEAKHGKEES